MKLYTKYLTLVLLGAGLALGACSSSSDDPPPPPPVVEPEPTAYEKALDAINMADTAAAAQAAYDAVDQTAVSGDEAAKLQVALASRLATLATAARVAEQKQALMTAAGAIDTSEDALSTQAGVDAARTAIAGLRGALTAAADVSDADKATYQTALNNAETAVDEAQGGIDTATRRTNQMGALSNASDTLQSALAALGGTPTQTLVDAANTALAGLNAALGDAADLTDEEKAPYQREATNASGPIQTAQTAVNDAKDDADDAADKAMAAVAAKLYPGLAIPDTAHLVAIAAENGAVSVDVSGDLANQALTVDKKTMVAAHHGWEGKRHTASGTGVTGTYEAVVYSNVGEPTQGDKFGQVGVETAATGYEYGLNAQGILVADGGGAFVWVPAQIASSSFDQSAGIKEFEQGTNRQYVSISGTYHGVSGEYRCTAATDNTCAVQIATEGFNLGGTTDADNAFTTGGGTWLFKPTNPEARVMSAPDTVYASYGWWIHKAADDGAFTAGAFAADRGNVPDATGITALRGTAKYMGGAAGKYALRSSTGGTNDAGHFTARATLDADFNDDTISGTIDNFMGADGESRNWSVELKEAAIADGGGITRVAEDDTVWTIGETAASASGEWTGNLQDNGADGVPKVGSGTFNSTFNDDGRMVGAFGVNKQ